VLQDVRVSSDQQVLELSTVELSCWLETRVYLLGTYLYGWLCRMMWKSFRNMVTTMMMVM
jgi:hypothetical protein